MTHDVLRFEGLPESPDPADSTQTLGRTCIKRLLLRAAQDDAKAMEYVDRSIAYFDGNMTQLECGLGCRISIQRAEESIAGNCESDRKFIQALRRLDIQ